MTYKLFDVVELNNDNKATILSINKNNKMYAEIVDNGGSKLENREIDKGEIKKIIYSKSNKKIR